MNDKTVELIKGIIERLGMETARVWPQVVMVTWVTSLFWLIVLPIIMTACAIGLWLLVGGALRHFKAEDRDTYDDAGMFWTFALIVGGGVLCFAFSLALAALPNALAGTLFPEAQTVINLAKSAGK